jgi:stage II sporulation SpoAA-like protein
LIDVKLLSDKGILVITPQGALTADDFRKVAVVADREIAEKGGLAGLLIHADSFPGWDSFGSLIEHLKFVRDHHRKIARVAAVTDSGFVKVARVVATHLAHPDIRQFPPDQADRALAWLETGK